MLKNTSQPFFLIKVTKIFLYTTLSVIKQLVNQKVPNLSYRNILLTQASSIEICIQQALWNIDSVLFKHIEFTPYGDYSSNTNLIKVNKSSETAAV